MHNSFYWNDKILKNAVLCMSIRYLKQPLKPYMFIRTSGNCANCKGDEWWPVWWKVMNVEWIINRTGVIHSPLTLTHIYLSITCAYLSVWWCVLVHMRWISPFPVSVLWYNSAYAPYCCGLDLTDPIHCCRMRKFGHSL